MAALDARLHGIPVVGRLVNGLANYTMSADGKVVVSSELHDVRLWDLATGEGRLVGRQPVGIREVRVSPDHRFIATAGFDNKIRLWSVGTGSMTELGGHETVVTDFEFLPDGDRLISASADGAIWLWRASGAGHQLIGRHPGGVAHIAASGDGRKLASSGADGAVRVWRVDGSGSGEPPRELRRGGARLDRVAISADGARVAAIGTPGEVWLWDVASGKGRHLSGHEGMMMTVAFSADGRLLAMAGEDRTVRLWDVETGESTLLRGHTDTVGQVTFAAAGTDLLFTAAFDETIRVWLVDGKSASTVQVLKGGVGPFGITPDGTMVVKYDEAGRRSWTVGDGRRTLRGHSGTVTQIEFAGDRAIVSAGADSTVRVWPLGEKAPGAPRVMRGHKADVTSLSASPDGRLAASIDKHRFVWLWDLAGGTGRELSGRAYGTPRFSPDGAILAAPSEDHVVRLWSTASGEARVLRGHTSWVTAVAISPDGRRLASASADKTIRLWDFDTGASRVLSGHETAVRAVEFAGAGRLVSSDMAGVVREWEVAGGAGRELGRANKGATALAVAPDGELVAWADGAGDTHLWSRRSGQSRVLHRHGRAPDIDQLLFSSDGRTLLGRDPDGLVILWDTSTDAFLVLPSYHRTIADLAMSPDAATVATAESDRSVRLWSYDLPYEPDALRAWLKKAARPASP